MTRICVVDDNGSIRTVCRELLEDEGYMVDELADGNVVEDYLKLSREPTVVLLDLRLPVKDGIEVLTAIARDSTLATRHAYIVMTAWPQMASPDWGWPEDAAAVLAQLQVPVLQKPFDLDDLLALIAGAAARLAAASGALSEGEGAGIAADKSAPTAA